MISPIVFYCILVAFIIVTLILSLRLNMVTRERNRLEKKELEERRGLTASGKMVWQQELNEIRDLLAILLNQEVFRVIFQRRFVGRAQMHPSEPFPPYKGPKDVFNYDLLTQLVTRKKITEGDHLDKYIKLLAGDCLEKPETK